MANTQVIMSRYRRLYMLMAALTLCSVAVWAQQWHTTLEITHQPAIRLQSEVTNILFVNNTVAHPDQPAGALFTLMAASEMVEGSRYIPSVLETSQNSSVSLYRRRLLSDQQADSLMQLYEADALIVLNQQMVHSNIVYATTDEYEVYGCVTGVAACHWSVYTRDAHVGNTHVSPIRSHSFTTSDTLYWESVGITQTLVAERLPSQEEAQGELMIYAGEQLAQRLVGTTEVVDRYLYDAGKKNAGMYAFTRQHWSEALAAWQTELSTLEQAAKSKAVLTQSAHIAANMAVTYEIIGDLPSALSLAEKSVSLFEQLRSSDARQQVVNMRYYQGLLQARMAE